jgi:pyroglutamyl-peptidase
MRTILITGFGPFPSAPFNPTEQLVHRLARERRPAVADVRIVPHIFRTSYAAVDRDLPALLRKYRPDAILMFGLAARTPHLRIESHARNAVAGSADVDRHAPAARVIDRGRPGRLALRTPAHRLLASARAAHVPAALSRDAGRYLCNYLCWRATAAAHGKDGPRLTAFIHVPLVRRWPLPAHSIRKSRVTMADLERASRGFLRVVASAIAAAP